MKTITLKISVFFFHLLSFYLLFAFKGVRFEENDDTLMALIASGNYTGTPDEHLVFIHPFIGKLLQLLYQIPLNIEWYTVLLSFLSILSFATISFILLTNLKHSLFKISFLIANLSFFLYCSILLQFTHVAFCCALAGCFIFLSNRNILFGASLLLLGSLVRFQAALLCVVILLPVFFAKLKAFKLRKTHQLIPFTLTIMLAFGLQFAKQFYYSTNDWQQFTLFNKARGQINGNPNAVLSNVILPSTISKNDYSCLLQNFANPAAIQPISLNKFAANLEQVSLLSKLPNSLSIFQYKLLILLLAVTFLLTLQMFIKRTKIIILLQCVIFTLAMIYLSLDTAVKYRVFYPSLFILIMSWSLMDIMKIHIVKNYLFATCLLLFGAYWLKLSTKHFINNQQLRKEFHVQTEFINNYIKETGKPLISYGASYRMEYGNPFTISSTVPKELSFAGWLVHSPHNFNRFSSFQSLIQQKAVFVKIAHYDNAKNCIQGSLSNKELRFKIINQSQEHLIMEIQPANLQETPLN